MKQKQNGFTLIEMSIVVLITVLIAGVSVANFREGERQKSVLLASDTVTNAIRNAQNFSLSGKKIETSTCVQGGIQIKAPKNYLVNFSATDASLYGIDKCGVANLIEKDPLPKNTKSNGFQLNGSAVSDLQLLFTPPFGAVTSSTGTVVSSGAVINTDAFTPFTSATIGVSLNDSTRPRTVNVDGVSGRIGE